MNYFYNEESEENFRAYPEWKQEKLMAYAKEHNLRIGIHPEQCLQVMYLYRGHYKDRCRYAYKGINLLEAWFVLPDDSIIEGIKDYEKPDITIKEKNQPTPSPFITLGLTQNEYPEWLVCRTGFPEDSGTSIYIVDVGTFRLFSQFTRDKRFPGSLYTQEKEGKTEYYYHWGYKQYSTNVKVTKELYDFVNQRIKELKRTQRQDIVPQH